MKLLGGQASFKRKVAHTRDRVTVQALFHVVEGSQLPYAF